MVIAQGEVWWAALTDPIGSSAGYRRPVLIVQGDALNASRIATALCVPLTSNLKWVDAPGNVLLPARETGLDRDSVANVSLLIAVDKAQLDERMGQVPRRALERVLAGIDVVLGR
ncbi:MAG: mRNA interferase MazF [Sphingomonadales bacterium]|jgi:mRNA interferase MazF|nr:mRNA interferase MazF [Sphingomonadales bacterium]MEA3045400.1 mRNA interferase MazF [Sphingomonadales bacterium]MEA3046485.1 mRNA interferase MazF [Sphingomonadales bacterium]